MTTGIMALGTLEPLGHLPEYAAKALTLTRLPTGLVKSRGLGGAVS
jgi:hypothetical protein